MPSCICTDGMVVLTGRRTSTRNSVITFSAHRIKNGRFLGLTSGNYHGGLAVYSTDAEGCRTDFNAEGNQWREGLKKWAGENYSWSYYNIYEVFKPTGKDGNILFCGTPEQEDELSAEMRKAGHDVLDLDAFMHLKQYKDKGNEECMRKYSKAIPYPVSPERVRMLELAFLNPVEAGRLQHQWVMDFPAESSIRRTYSAVAVLVEGWRRPVRVRDILFNLAGQESESNVFPTVTDEGSGKPVPDVVGWFVG